MIIREAHNKDFEKVWPLLDHLNNKLPKTKWQQLFVSNFSAPYNFPGYVLEDDQEIVGFFGTIFSQRTINGRQYNFCNTSSWVVNENYRSHSLLLLLKIHKLKNCIFTNFTPSSVVYPILKKLGYNDLSSEKLLFRPSLALSSKLKIQSSNFESILNEDEIQIYNDHKQYNADFLVALSNEGHCLIVLKKKKYTPAILKKIAGNVISSHLGEIEFISNPNVFNLHFREILFKSALIFKLTGLTIYKQFLSDSLIKKGQPFTTHRRYLYKGDIAEKSLDTLYSEIFILDI